MDQAGQLLYAFDFAKKENILDQVGDEVDKAVLTAGFLSALSGFSGQMLNADSSFSIRTGGSYFALVKVEDKLVALQALNYLKSLDQRYTAFAKKVSPMVVPGTAGAQNGPEVKQVIETYFKGFY